MLLGDIRKSRCTIGINDTDRKFATSVIYNTGGKFAPVSGTPVVHLELRIFP
jgi:hypothetical protein